MVMSKNVGELLELGWENASWLFWVSFINIYLDNNIGLIAYKNNNGI